MKKLSVLIVMSCLFLSGCIFKPDPRPTTKTEVTTTATPAASNSSSAEPSSSEYQSSESTTESIAEKARSIEGAGILAMSIGNSNTGIKEITLTSINPETGYSQVIRMFTASENVSFAPIQTLTSTAYNPQIVRQNFDSTYSKMVAQTVSSSDGSTNVGWVDLNGNFFNLSSAISVDSGNDFSDAVTLHSTPAIDANDNFYFYDSKKMSGNVRDKGVTVRKVPINNVNRDNLVDINNSVTSFNYYIQPNGEYVSADTIAPMSDASGEQYAGSTEALYDWVDKNTYLSADQKREKIYLTKTLPTNSIDGHEKKSLLPEIENRKNWNAVTSPDGSQVAFLSSIKTATEPPELFVVPSSGGEPQKVKTDYVFNRDDILQILVWK